MTQGLFVSFEGGEGAGKTTQARLLHQRLLQQGRRAVPVHEPGSSPLGEHLRSYLKGGGPLTPGAELLLFMAARAELSASTIRPELREGSVVVADRFEASTVAYQGYGRGLDLTLITQLNRFATGGRVPDLTFLLDIEPAQGLGRAGRRPEDQGQSRFEEELLDFHRRVRQGFGDLARAEPERWKTIDASLPEEQVAQQVWKIVDQRLPAGPDPPGR